MKTWKQLATISMAIFVVMILGACGKKKNGSTAASTPASTCTQTWNGQYVDNYGRQCNPSYATSYCANPQYNQQTGQWIDPRTGQICNYGQGTSGNGLYGGTQASCAGWTYYYPGNYYVPVDMGYGQIVCMNTAYLGQQMGYGNYFTNYYDYFNQHPLYSCGGYDCSGGYYSGHNYSCRNSFNFGFDTGDFAFGAGLCF